MYALQAAVAAMGMFYYPARDVTNAQTNWESVVRLDRQDADGGGPPFIASRNGDEPIVPRDDPRPRRQLLLHAVREGAVGPRVRKVIDACLILHARAHDERLDVQRPA